MKAVLLTIALAAGSLLASGLSRAGDVFHLRPYINVSQTFNDNIYGTKNNRRSDFISTISPSVALDWNRTSSVHRVTYTASSDIFWEADNQTTLSHAGNWVSDFTPSPNFSLKFLERLSYSPVTSAEIFPEISTEPQTVRTKTLRNTTEVSETFRLTERTDLTVPSRFTAFHFQSEALLPTTPTFLAQDTYQAYGAFVLAHRLSERDTLTPTGTYSHYWFSGGRDADVVGGDLQWSRKWTARTTSTIGAGFAQTIQGTSGGSSTDVTGNASWQYQFEHVGLGLAYGRSVEGGAGTGFTLIQDTGTISVTWTINDNWALSSANSIFHSTSQRTGTHLSFLGGSADVVLTYRFSPAFMGTLGYNFRIQSARGTGGTSFYRNLASLTFRVIDL